MKPVDLFLREHAFVHTEAVARAESFNIDYLLDGMTEAELRMRPHDMILCLVVLAYGQSRGWIR